MGACARNMQSDPAEIKPAQCRIKLVFRLTYTMLHGSTKLKCISPVSKIGFLRYLGDIIHLSNKTFSICKLCGFTVGIIVK